MLIYIKNSYLFLVIFKSILIYKKRFIKNVYKLFYKKNHSLFTFNKNSFYINNNIN